MFSRSSTLYSDTTLDRVADAINAGEDYTTRQGCESGGGTPVATDIAQDFFVPGPNSTIQPDGRTSTVIRVPTGAAHLFVCADDSFFGDNADANNNYRIRITALCPADFNGEDGVTVQDIYDFLAAYSTECP